ncbi:MAG: oligoendopeptidase F, partial [Lachnospiraceae bacterium]|nr:oligoendopeptidase F [Lachnospiraceae bacterium]
MDQNSVINREQQKTEDTWNMQDLYATEELFQEDAEKLSCMMEEFSSMKGSLGKGEPELLKTLQLYEQMNEVFESLYVYAFQKYHEDTTNPKYQQMSGEMQIIASNLSQAVSWMEPELLSLPENAFEREKMAKYKRFILQIVRQKAHVLDDEKEALLARAGELGQSPSNIFSMFNNADIRFPEVEDTEGTKRVLTVGNYISFMQSKDRVLRRNAFEALYSVYGQFINTLAATFYANLKQADFFAKEHRY